MHGVSSVDFALDRTARVLQLKPTLKTSELQKAIESVLKELGDQKVSVTMSTKTDTYGTQLAELTANYAFAVAIPFLDFQVQLPTDRYCRTDCALIILAN